MKPSPWWREAAKEKKVSGVWACVCVRACVCVFGVGVGFVCCSSLFMPSSTVTFTVGKDQCLQSAQIPTTYVLTPQHNVGQSQLRGFMAQEKEKKKGETPPPW